ncbi:nodulin-related protein 1-like [Populus alba x Populus x berolinensis]|nr:nodulin-related protein 1-like [Populus alba x Populus x berolinensis]
MSLYLSYPFDNSHGFTSQGQTNRHDRPPTTSELLSSAKLVAGAAQASFGSEGDKIDRAKVAGAAEDLLEAASKYGKLDQEKGMGQLLEKAETYLHQYHSNTLPTATPSTTGSGHTAPVDKKETAAPPSTRVDDDQSGSGLGGAFKMAQGFFKIKWLDTQQF